MNLQKDLFSFQPRLIVFIAAADVLVLIVMFALVLPLVAGPSVKAIRLPRAVTSDMFGRHDLEVMISDENILYFDGRIVTLDELGKVFSSGKSVLIKADQGASVGRVGDVWDLARRSGIERINMATARQD